MSDTVAVALARFRARHGLPPEDQPVGPFVVRVGPFSWAFPNPGRLHRHDLHHLALDAPPSFWGEVAVSAFELRTGPPTRLIAFLCVGAVVLGFVGAPWRVVRAWRRARGCRNLYDDPIDDGALRAGTLDALRARIGLDAQPS